LLVDTAARTAQGEVSRLIESPLRLVARLPATVRVLIAGTFVNKIGSFIVPYLTLVLWRDFRLSGGAIGLVMLSYGLGSIASVVLGGILTDRLGRRATLLSSLLGSGVLAMALGVTGSVRVFVVLLVLLGFIADLYRPAASAIIGDLLPSHARAVGFAALRMAVNLGFAGGMALGGAIAHWSWRLLFIGDGLTTFLFGLIVLALIPETRPARAPQSEKPKAEHGESPWHDFTLWKLLAGSFLFKVAFYSAFTVLPLTMTEWAGYSTMVYGAFVGLNGLMVALFEISVVHGLRHRRRLRLATFGLVLSISGLALNGVAPLWPLFLASVVIWTIGEMLSVPQQMAFVADWAPASARGQYLSLFQATWSLGMALNPILMLPLYSWLGPRVFWLSMPILALPGALIMRDLDRNADQPARLRGLTAA
jgi:MFS family permease